MADNVAGEHEKEDSFVESVKDKISETFHKDDSSSSSDSDNEGKKSSSVSDVKDKIYRLFGREKPVHKLLGGGKPADIFLWKDKKVSAALAVLFLWSNAASFINKSPPKFPEVNLPEDIVLGVASALRVEINKAFEVLRCIASGKDLKKFLGVVAGLWVLSIVGSCWNFLTLFYICFVLLHTLPYLYDKYEDKVDAFGEKAEAEIKKQYAVFSVKVLSKIPVGALKHKFA
ncbi:unnamed protein product [Lactuca virosa]|uniref:Reticulon-like protein n=1 Tax=Lactuca virosa TaxID=75947 RepID=A0AAU9P5S8_9ASTR|nr:unnamed protein product [Lactuca virosa]